MTGTTTASAAAAVREAARALTSSAHDYDPLLELIGNARVVLLGEASHGTHEFYRERARITQRLIEEKGFIAVAVEADWPDAYRVNRWVRGVGPDRSALDALRDFERFPRWMWRNRDVLRFAEWLRRHNDSRRPEQRVGFYGLDLYSLFRSMEAVIGFLQQVDPEAARRARYRYSCFEDFGEDAQCLRLRRRVRPGSFLRGPGGATTSRPPAPRRRAGSAGWAHSGRRALLRRAKCEAGQKRGRILPHHVPGTGLLLEFA